jgi:hypothetical protein
MGKPWKLSDIYAKEHPNPTKRNKPALPSVLLKPAPKLGKTNKKQKAARAKQSLVVVSGIVVADAATVAATVAISSTAAQPTSSAPIKLGHSYGQGGGGIIHLFWKRCPK